MKINYLILAFAFIFLIGIVSGGTETYQVNTEVNLKLTCTVNNAIPSAGATMNLTIAYPNGTLLVDNKPTTARGSGIFNYTITFPSIGTYYPTLMCVDGSDSNSDSSGVYNITPNGIEMSGWKIAVEIFAAMSTLVLFLLFLYLSGSGIKSGMAKQEQGGMKFFFMGLSLVFLIAHIMITNVIIHDTLGADSSMASSYTSIMYIFFTIIILVFLYTLVKIILWEVDIFMKSKGLK